MLQSDVDYEGPTEIAIFQQTNRTMKVISILVFSCLFLSATAQIKNTYTKGSILFTNGDILDCEIAFPILNRSMSLGPTIRSKNKVTVKDMLGKKQKIDIDEIDALVFEGTDGFYSMKVMHSFTMKRKGKVKQTKHKSWYIIDEGCDELQGYVRADKFDLDRKGHPYALHVDNLGQFLLQREGEEWPTVISTALTYRGINKKQFWKIRRNSFALYMGEDKHAKEFLDGKKRITGEELTDYVIERCK